MFSTTSYLLRIILYIIFIIAVFLWAKFFDKHQSQITAKKPSAILIFTLFTILVCSFMGGYSAICGQNPRTSDRYNYAFRYEDDKEFASVSSVESVGLAAFESPLRQISKDADLLFFATAFTCTLLTLISYIILPKKDSKILLFLASSQYFLYSCFLLKQSLAIAIIALAYATYNRTQKKPPVILLTLLAALFHESALVVFAYQLLYRVARNKKARYILYIIFFIFVVLFQQIGDIGIKTILAIFPSFAHQLSAYIGPDGRFLTLFSPLTWINYLPIIFIAVYAIIERKNLEHKISNYNQKMMICIFSAILCFLSVFMYWTFRFSLYALIPNIVFATEIANVSKSKRSYTLYLCMIVLFLIFTLKALVQYYFLYGGF